MTYKGPFNRYYSMLDNGLADTMTDQELLKAGILKSNMEEERKKARLALQESIIKKLTQKIRRTLEPKGF